MGNVQTGGQQGLFLLQLLGESTDVVFKVRYLFICFYEGGVVGSHGMKLAVCFRMLTVGGVFQNANS